MTPLLEARGISKHFGGGLGDRGATVALTNLSLAIDGDRPSITAVVGESGSGKTTLARLLLGLVTPTHGEVRYRGRDLRGLSGADWRAFRREVQAVFQDPYGVYNPFYRVDHVLTTPVAKFKLADSRVERRRLIEAALESVGLRPDETLGRFPHQLSGGQRQRVMVARALLTRPRVILADEPVSMVDASLRATILGALDRLTRELGIAVLYVTHDLATAYQVSEHAVVLYRGGVVEAGGIEGVVKAPRHPYTQLLLASIPLVSAERTWAVESAGPGSGDGTSTQAGALGDDEGAGCLFAGRCPSTMAVCRRAAPPLYLTEPGRAVACYLYDGAPVLPPEELTVVLAGASPRSVALEAGRGTRADRGREVVPPGDRDRAP